MVFLCLAGNSIQLVPDGTIFIHIALILLMVFILNKTLFKPINHILAERERRTRGRSEEAEGILRRVDANMSRYEKSLREARADSYRLLEQERGGAMLERQSKLDAVREEVGRSIAVEKESIQTQVDDAKATLTDEAQLVAAGVSAQILGRPVGGTIQPGSRN